MGTRVPEMCVEILPQPVPARIRAGLLGARHAHAGQKEGTPTGEQDNGDPSLDNRRWGSPYSANAPEVPVHKRTAQARACQTCADVCIPKFMNFEEEWDLQILGEECEHDWAFEAKSQGSELAWWFGLARVEAEEFMK